jgi:hypothetical protein
MPEFSDCDRSAERPPESATGQAIMRKPLLPPKPKRYRFEFSPEPDRVPTVPQKTTLWKPETFTLVRNQPKG